MRIVSQSNRIRAAPTSPAPPLVRLLALTWVMATVGPVAWAVGEQASPPLNQDRLVSQMRLWTHSPRRQILAVTPEMGLILLRSGASDPKNGAVEGVEVQGEITDDDLAAQRGWRSMRLRLDVACPGRRAFVRQFVVFTGHNRMGSMIARPAPAGWVQPSPGAYLNPVIDAVCPARIAAVAADLQVVKPSPPKLSPAITPPLATGPLRTAGAGPPAAPSVTPAQAGPITVQVNASPDEAGARAILDELSKTPGLSLTGLSLHVAPAQVRGAQVYRALVTGLDSRAAARAFCASVRQGGGACFLR